MTPAAVFRFPSRAGKRAVLPLDVALQIADQIADALEAAHGQGIVHRDLKPASVSVTTGGSIKVLDSHSSVTPRAILECLGNT